MPNNYGTPVQMREAIQAERVALAYLLVLVHSDASAKLFERLVADVDNEMLSVSIDKGLPFLSYASTPADRWNSDKRISVSMKRFLRTRLGISKEDAQDLADAVVSTPCTTCDDFNYPK